MFLRQREKLQFQDFCKSDSAESADAPPPPPGTGLSGRAAAVRGRGLCVEGALLQREAGLQGRER